jgi:RNA polymerase sigma-70 factor, ECF subfamily
MDDATLLLAVRRMDKDALVDVFDNYAPLLYKYALRLCGNATEADDIVGDVFAELLKHLKAGKGPQNNLRSYLYQIAYHRVVDHARNRKHTTPLEDDLPISGGKSLPSQHEDWEQMDALKSIIENELNDDQRHVIVLRFIEDFSVQETAEIVGKNIGNVKVIQSRAIAKLRLAMEQRA